MVFGRKDMSCPRCLELVNGAAPKTWNIRTKTLKAAVKHDCKVSGCAIVCTFGDW